jgi:hypothetical protein
MVVKLLPFWLTISLMREDMVNDAHASIIFLGLLLNSEGNYFCAKKIHMRRRVELFYALKN